MPAGRFSVSLAGLMRCVAQIVAGCLLAGVTAGVAAVPPKGPAAAPTAPQIGALQAEAATTGWEAVAQKLRTAAIASYRRSPGQAEARYYLYRWADLFGTTESQALARWADDVGRAKIGYPRAEPDIDAGDRPLAALWPEDLRRYALTSSDFSEAFFTQLSPLDQPVMVMKILAAIWTRDPAVFREYANLALALAVVYDVPPPADWPHGQVRPQALPRRLPDPVEAFAFFVKADRTGATLQRLSRLPAEDLKYVVDTSASFADLTWAETKVAAPLAGLARLYNMVRYRRDRLEGDVLIWPEATYRLADIAERGGICIDQAYFAAMVGKAKGVPTLLFRGAGLDGRHAWFGFLDGNGRWQLDCGRDAAQKLVTGFAFDPQTWTNITDHDLAFLADGFRRLPMFKASRVNAQFADLFFGMGEFTACAAAARAAVNNEPRNVEAWNTLLVARQRLGGDPKQLEGLLREGARTFERYPDIESNFKLLLSRSLRTRGATSEADFVERSTAHKYEADRSDLSDRQAEEKLLRSLTTEDIDQCIMTYFSVLKSYGNGAGINFFDRIVRPFVEYLLLNGRPVQAQQAVETARRTLRVEPNSQLELNLNVLSDRAREAGR